MNTTRREALALLAAGMTSPGGAATPAAKAAPAAAAAPAAPPIPTARAAAAVTPRRKMPKGFLWGAAISAHQSEGNDVNSDSWLLENLPETVYKEPSGDACDSYHRYEEDFAIAKSLGLNCYRFGIEWARIEPEPGTFSQAELDHYVEVLTSCRAHGLLPIVTYNHFTVPRWLHCQADNDGCSRCEGAQLPAVFLPPVCRS